MTDMTPHDHIVKSFDEELARLSGEIARMGELAVGQLDAAVDLLRRRDARAAGRVVANDDEIDALERAVGHDALHLLALRQPRARDLREIYAALRISAALERIGDYAANVAKRSVAIDGVLPPAPAERLPRLAASANALVAGALESYLHRDAEAAAAVRARDVELDADYTALFRELLAAMTADPRRIATCTQLLFMARNIERIGDHATTIAESTWFLVHGEPMAGERAKGDRTSAPPAIGDRGP